jgi:hypothetical protein
MHFRIKQEVADTVKVAAPLTARLTANPRRLPVVSVTLAAVDCPKGLLGKPLHT